jgi:hypothetical protein
MNKYEEKIISDFAKALLDAIDEVKINANDAFIAKLLEHVKEFVRRIRDTEIKK